MIAYHARSNMLVRSRRTSAVQPMHVFGAIIAGASLFSVFLQLKLKYNAFTSLSFISSPQLAPNSLRLSSSLTSSDKRQLLLVTLGRSGSSYTSALINKDRDVFFTFEPLHNLNNLDLYEMATRERAYGILKAFLLCDFTRIWARDLNEVFLARSGRAERRFLRCVRSKRYGFDHIACLMDMVKHCQSKQLTFSKVIRLPMSLTEPLLRDMPNLKILYLIRDPRAVIRSQAKVFQTFKWPGDVPEVAQTHCKQLKNDTAEVTRLQRMFPGRIQVVRYENCVVNPVQYAKDIYTFSGLKFTNETLAYVGYLQKAGKREAQYVYGVRRANPDKVINGWRKGPGAYEAATFVDEACGEVYPKLGYIPVLSEQDILSNRSLINNIYL